MANPLSDLAIVLTFLRAGLGWSQAGLGEAAGVSANLLNDYEKGRKPLHRDRLEFLIAFLGLGPEAIDDALAKLDSLRDAARSGAVAGGDPAAATGRRIEAVVARSSRLMADFVRSALTLLTREGERLRARDQAEPLWKRLEKRSPEERLALVESGRKFRHWGLCERVAAASIEEAASRPAEALKLALLARRIAELAGGSHLWRLRLQGYAAAHVANVLRVNNDLPGADAEMARARKLWEDGAAEDPGLLSEAWVPWIEATLRDAQRRFPEALRRIEDALAADPGDLRAKLLLTKAQILHALGDVAGSTATLGEAAPLIDPKREPRVAFGAEFQRLANLALEGRAAEAEPGLPRVRALGEQLGNEMDLTKVLWVEAKVAAGVGRAAEAEAAFVQVRQEFTSRLLAFNAALVSLDLTVLLLEQGRTAEVRQLAEAMGWIFQAQGVERETLAALRLFCDAARREAASVELAKRLVQYLHRAQHHPELRFEAGEEAEAR